MNLRTYLIEEIGCLDNEYLTEYINLITTYTLAAGYSEQHHIIPVAYYFKKYGCKSKCEAKRKYADKDPQNGLVQLLYKDHIKAHWLLYNCTTGYLKQANAKAYKRMLNEKYTYKFEHRLTDEEYAELQYQMDQIVQSEDTAYWSAKDTKWLVENFRNYSYAECGKYLNKTALALQHKIFALGLTKYKMWTEDEVEWLKTNILIYSAKECGEYLNRPVCNVQSKLSELGLTNLKPKANSVKKEKQEKKERQEKTIIKKEKSTKVKLTEEERLERRRTKYKEYSQTAEYKQKRKEKYEANKEKLKQYAREYYAKQDAELRRQKRHEYYLRKKNDPQYQETKKRYRESHRKNKN